MAFANLVSTEAPYDHLGIVPNVNVSQTRHRPAGFTHRPKGRSPCAAESGGFGPPSHCWPRVFETRPPPDCGTIPWWSSTQARLDQPGTADSPEGESSCAAESVRVERTRVPSAHGFQPCPLPLGQLSVLRKRHRFERAPPFGGHRLSGPEPYQLSHASIKAASHQKAQSAGAQSRLSRSRESNPPLALYGSAAPPLVLDRQALPIDESFTPSGAGRIGTHAHALWTSRDSNPRPRLSLRQARWIRADSNCTPLPCRGSVLPDELRTRFRICNHVYARWRIAQ